MVGVIGVYGGVGAAALLLPTYLGRVALEAQDQAQPTRNRRRGCEYHSVWGMGAGVVHTAEL